MPPPAHPHAHTHTRTHAHTHTRTLTQSLNHSLTPSLTHSLNHPHTLTTFADGDTVIEFDKLPAVNILISTDLERKDLHDGIIRERHA